MAFLQWHNGHWLLVIARDRMLGCIHALISISTPKIIKLERVLQKYTEETKIKKKKNVNIIGV